MLRSSKVGPSLSIRSDVPFYALKSDSYSYASNGGTVHTESYVIPISLNLGIGFH